MSASLMSAVASYDARTQAIQDWAENRAYWDGRNYRTKHPFRSSATPRRIAPWNKALKAVGITPAILHSASEAYREAQQRAADKQKQRRSKWYKRATLVKKLLESVTAGTDDISDDVSHENLKLRAALAGIRGMASPDDCVTLLYGSGFKPIDVLDAVVSMLDDEARRAMDRGDYANMNRLSADAGAVHHLYKQLTA
jgi:hypothetical protein